MDILDKSMSHLIYRYLLIIIHFSNNSIEYKCDNNSHVLILQAEMSVNVMLIEILFGTNRLAFVSLLMIGGLVCKAIDDWLWQVHVMLGGGGYIGISIVKANKPGIQWFGWLVLRQGGKGRRRGRRGGIN